MFHSKPHLTVLLGVLFISFSAIFIRMSDAPSLIIAFYRLAFTVMMLLPFFLTGSIRELKDIKKKDFLLSVLSGVFLALHFFVFMESLNYTSVTSSTVLVTIHPIFVGFGTFYILREKMPPGFIRAVIITFFGGIIISISDAGQGSFALLGDLLAFIGALFMTFYMLIGRIVRQEVSVGVYTFIVYFASTITLFILNLFTKKPFLPYDVKDWVLFFAMALVCTILGHNILNWALKYLNPTFISTAILGEPVFATLWALLFFREYPGTFQIIGSGIVISGLILLIRKIEVKSIN